MGHLHTIECEDVVVFIRGLQQNVTITALSLYACRLHQVSYERRPVFAGYLRENKTLTTLGVASCYQFDCHEVSLITEALVTNTSLCELDLAKFWIDPINTQSIARLLCENRTLKSFNLIECLRYEPANVSMHDTENFGSVSSRIYPWLMAFTENETLDKLTLDLSWFSKEECELLLQVLASHKSLTKVNVQRVRNMDIAEIFKTVRKAGQQERFSVCTHHILRDNLVAFAECEGMWSVSVDSALLPVDSLHSVLGMLPSCDHVTGLRLTLRLEHYNSDIISLIATYLTSTTALRELELSFLGFGITNAVGRPERAMVQALSVNKITARLCVIGLTLDETETRILADMLSSSRTIVSLAFYPDDHRSAISLVQKLSCKISRNYTLLRAQITECVGFGSDWFTVADVVRRNNSLVTRATRFVTGTEHRYGAEALELVHSTPGLVAKVQKTPHPQTKTRPRSGSGRTSGAFLNWMDSCAWRGVVKDSVTCRRGDDGQTQLRDLNKDCWFSIR
ncbi:hypothetical protein MTO96_043050 [Rhipicephalus appendiculatus]